MKPTPQAEYYTIELTRGQIAFVDACDFEWLSQYKWRAHWNPGTRSFYATRTTAPGSNSTRQTFYMHREILGLAPGDPREGDHINTGCTLDNRRSNLRVSTHVQNCRNRRKPTHNSSGLKGVQYVRSTGRWRGVIGINWKRIHLGYFDTPEEAYAAYCEAAALHHGDFARLV